MNKLNQLSAVTPRDEKRLRIDFEAFLHDLLYIHPSVIIKMARDAVDRGGVIDDVAGRLEHFDRENCFPIGSMERTIFYIAYMNRRKELQSGADGEVAA